MSQDEQIAPEPAGEADDGDIEVVDGVPVLAEVRPVAALAPASVPAVQTAAAAVTGFVAGAATVALVRLEQLEQQDHKTEQLQPLRAMPMVSSGCYASIVI